MCSIKTIILKFIDPNQFGYVANSNTTCLLIKLHDYVTKALEHSNVDSVAIVTFDFFNAFDTISHDILLRQLTSLNFPVCDIQLIYSYVTNRRQRVRYKCNYSTICSISSGVPQGSILGPFLFILYIADLLPLDPTTFYAKYADDLTLAIPIRKQKKSMTQLKIFKKSVLTL